MSNQWELSGLLEARNTCIEIVNKSWPLWHNYFQQFIGKKITLANDRLTKKVKEGLPDVVEVVPSARFIQVSDRSELEFEVSCSVNPKGNSIYHSHKVLIGRLEGTILMELMPVMEIPLMMEEEMMEKIEKAKDLYNAINKLKQERYELMSVDLNFVPDWLLR